MTAAETAPVADVVAAWATAWQERTPARLIALWDKTDDQSWFLPAGSVEPYLGHAVVGFIQRRCLRAAAIGYKVGALHTRRLAPDLGLAFFALDWSERPTDHPIDGPGLMGGRVRVTMMMRAYADVWRVFHYAEAPLAPLLELQAFYEAVAAEGLGAIPSRAFNQTPRP